MPEKAIKTSKNNTTQQVTIPAPNLVIAEFKLRGTAPFVQHKFSAKAKAQIRATQVAGSTATGKKKRTPKDFDAAYEAAKHISEEGWCGIPAPAFRSAMISACRLVGFQMTKAKLSVFILADGIDAEDGTPLVKIEGEPQKHEGHVRNETGVVDLRARPMWRKWSCRLRVRFDADQFTQDDMANLLLRAGMQVGIGEGRPDSKKSHGCGWGTFELC